MRCTRVEKLLPLHVAGDLAGRRARAVADHLTTCAECRRSASRYDASRNLLREVALPPDFDGAFYEELRRSVLERIGRDRTLVPPAPAGFASLFNARLAYAASLVFVALAAALAFYSYDRRTYGDGARDKMVANVNHEQDAPPAATRETTQAARKDEPQTSSTINEAAPDTPGEVERASSKSPLTKRRATGGKARDAVRPDFVLTKQTPSRVEQNSPAPNVARRSQPNAEEPAVRSVATTAAESEVSRIEIQTSDPNIRIIWLSPKPEDAATQPLK